MREPVFGACASVLKRRHASTAACGDVAKGEPQVDSVERRVKQLEKERRQQEEDRKKRTAFFSPFVQKAIRDPLSWTRYHTKTYNEHWKEEGRPSPQEPFPALEYFEHAFDIMDLGRITFWEKSRDMMLSWACVAYLEWFAMTTGHCGILFQTQKEDKVKQLVKYAKELWINSDPRIQEACPLVKPPYRQSDYEFEFANGSYIVGIPGGADQIRSYHPFGYLNDESSFQPAAGECYQEALAAVKGKIIFNSSAGPGWYSDFRKDIIRNEE